MLFLYVSFLLIFYGVMMQAGLDHPFGILVTAVYAAISAFLMKFQLNTFVGGKVLELSSEARMATGAQPPNLFMVHAIAAGANIVLAFALCYAFEEKTFREVWRPFLGRGDWTDTAFFVATACIPPAANGVAASTFWKNFTDQG